MARLLFATDLHGNRSSYGRLMDHALAAGAEAVVLGGDLTPLPPREGGKVAPQREFIEGFLAGQLREFRRLHPRCGVWLLMGNDDWACNMDALETLEAEGLCRLLHMKAQPFLDDLWIAGYSCVPITPFAMKDWDRFDERGWEPARRPARGWRSRDGEIVEADIERDLRPLPTIAEDLEWLGHLSDPARTVYVCHTPPMDTRLDVLWDGSHIGSAAVRDFLARHRPPLSLHGHVHESPRMSGSISDRVGRTFCVNPGDSLAGLQAVLLDTSDPAGTLETA